VSRYESRGVPGFGTLKMNVRGYKDFEVLGAD
jgi:hypothetical protein